jgi:hypothetical protein
MRPNRDELRDFLQHRFARIGASLVLLAAVVTALMMLLGTTRRPPSIFDSPVDDVLSFLAVEEFSALPLDERLQFMRDVFERFGAMNQSDSAVAAAFLAGLTGPAREQLRDNVRVLARDVLVEAADEYFSLQDEAARRAFLDGWLLQWARFASEVTGRNEDASDQELLADMRRDASRDNEHAIRNPIASTESNAWLFMDYWHSEVESVSTPSEQSKILHFLPALREHMLRQPE